MQSTRRDFMKAAGVTAAGTPLAARVHAAESGALGAASSEGASGSDSARRPNVLFIHTDQQRWDTLACAGYPHMQTPNLDALAAGGVRFENAFCNNPVCMPSRQSMLSGLYPSTLGCSTNGVEMREDVETIHKILKRYGYHTACIGKLHFLNHSNRDHRVPHPAYGFDHLEISDEPGCYDDAYIKWVETQDPAQVENCRCSTPPEWKGKQIVKQPRNTHEPYLFPGPEHLTHTAFVATQTINYMRQHREEPFFCFSGIYAPHTPVNPPKRFVELYEEGKLPLPAMNPNERKRFGLTDAEWLKIRAYYYALVSHVDDQVGRILRALDELGLRENTLVVFTSDHGEHLGDHGTIQKGPPGLDSCAHVPLIISYPGRIKSAVRPELAELIDLAPTVLDYCGIQTPPGFQGRSLQPLLDGKKYQARSSAFIEHRRPFGTSWKTVRTHKFKYCTNNSGTELLFDIERDPKELSNVVGERNYAEALHAMREELVRRWFEVENQYPLQTGSY